MATTLNPSESQAFHADSTTTGTPISKLERERFLRPYLPTPNKLPPPSPPRKGRFARPRIRPLLAAAIYTLIFHLIQAIFTVYIHLRRAYHHLTSTLYAALYYHHRSPELIQRDVRNLPRLPQHLSIIVDLASTSPEDLQKLLQDVAECAAWCICAGIPHLSVYERTGALKTHVPSLDRACRDTLHSYFPPASAPRVKLRAPLQSFSPGGSRSPSPNYRAIEEANQISDRAGLDLLLLSSSDGRATLVDLTKTLAEMAQKRKLGPSDITTSLIDAEVCESSCGEPDLLVVMAPSDTSSLGPRRRRRRKGSASRDAGLKTSSEVQTGEVVGGGGEICLRGYPPWQARLTEIFAVKDGRGVDYQVFLRALHRYAKAEFRFGR